MKFKLLFQNVRGLNDPVALDNLKNYVSRNPVDFLFLQEHKLRGTRASQLGRSLWKQATTFYTKADVGYTIDGRNAGKGGVASLISPKWTKLIDRHGSLFGGRAHWFTITRVHGGNLGFVNIYAPHEPHPRRFSGRH